MGVRLRLDVGRAAAAAADDDAETTTMIRRATRHCCMQAQDMPAHAPVQYSDVATSLAADAARPATAEAAAAVSHDVVTSSTNNVLHQHMQDDVNFFSST